MTTRKNPAREELDAAATAFQEMFATGYDRKVFHRFLRATRLFALTEEGQAMMRAEGRLREAQFWAAVSAHIELSKSRDPQERLVAVKFLWDYETLVQLQDDPHPEVAAIAAQKVAEFRMPDLTTDEE